MRNNIERKLSRKTLYGVFKDDEIKSYRTAAEAFHTAQQNGGYPFRHYMGYSNSQEIVRDSLNEGMTGIYVNGVFQGRRLR